MATPSLNPDECGVDSYHINVGQGDCAIHLLVQHNVTAAPPKKPLVLHAVLIDGGESDAVNIAKIRQTIDHIEGEYDFAGGATTLQFDSVVVTHWDSDHFKGVIKLIEVDLTDQLSKPPVVADGARVGCRLFKYDGGDRTKPQTIFFAPYWNGMAKAPSSKPPPKKPKVIKTNDRPETVVESSKPGHMDFIIKIPAAKKVPAFDIPFQALCKLRYAVGDVLGMNLFTHEEISARYEDLKSPKDLIDNISHKYPVGMFCVTSCGAVIGHDEDPFEVFTIDKPNEHKNWYSIGAVVLWEGSARISHYFCGDAMYKQEDMIREWVNNGAVKTITSLKLSHHGSATSTPTASLELFQPENMVVSAGTSANYGHPRWEILFYINAWLLSRGRTHAARRPLYATQYPYYLRHDDSKQFPNRTYGRSTFLKPDAPEKRFNATLKKLYDDVNTAAAAAVPPLQEVLDIQSQFDAWKTSIGSPPTGSEDLWDYKILAWISYQVERAWIDMSFMYQPAAKRPTYTDYILVKSRDSVTSGEGKVEVVIAGAPETYTAPSAHAALSIPRATTAPTAPPPGPAPLYPDISSALIGTIGPKSLFAFPPAMASPSPSTDATDPAPYYIVSHDTPASGANIEKLVDGTPLNALVTCLRTKQFGLTSKPAASTSTPFLVTDQWLLWLTDAVSATSFAAKSDSTGTLSGFALSLDWPKSGGSPTTLKFDTDFVVSAFEIPADEKPPLGLLGDTNTLVLALDPTQGLKLKTDLAAAFVYAGLGGLLTSPLVAALGTTIGLTLASETSVSSGARNAVWFQPGEAYRTTVRLQWSIDQTDTIREYIGFLKGTFTLGAVSLITRRTCTWALTVEGATVVASGEVLLAAELVVVGKTFQVALGFGEDSLRVELSTKENVFADILEWLQETTGEIPLAGWLAGATEVFKRVMLRRVTMNVKMRDGKKEIVGFTVAVEVDMGLGASADNPARMLLTYASAPGRKKMGKLRGQLWLVPAAPIPALLFPGWEKAQELSPLTPGTSSSLDLAKLCPGTDIDIPAGIPHQITDAALEVDGTSVSFFGSLSCVPPPPGAVPTITLGLVSLDARYTIAAGPSKGALALQLDVAVTLTAPEDSPYQTPTELAGSLRYDDGAWTLRASMSPMFAATLYSFFDPDARDGVLTFLEALEIKRLALEYNYIKGAANDFTFDGAVALGELELDLKYTYTAAGWSFEAALGAASGDSTLGSIVDSILDEEGTLPGFVADIPVAASAGGGLVALRCSKKEKAGAVPKSYELFYSVSVAIKPLKATFVQYRDVSWGPRVPPKRAFKVSVTELPAVDVPLVGNLTQPFDEMYYLWVQDGAQQASTKKLPGLAASEVVAVNAALGTLDQLLFKETRKEGARKDTDVVIAAGSHFVLVLHDKDTRSVIIDYAFGQDKKGSKTRALAAGGDAGGPGDSAMQPYKKSLGPVSIANIGFKYAGDRLSILLDAAFVLGPIGFTLLAFSIDVNLKGATLQHLPRPGFSLGGLAVAFDQDPIRIAGLYTHVVTDDLDYYAGGVIVAFKLYLFEAAGFYGKTKKPHEFTSVFVFGRLKGPLITLEFAEISGITGGFGYNTDMLFPSVDKVPEFPFVSGTGVGGGDLMQTLQNLVTPTTGGWFNPRDGSFWVAAGLSVTAFETLSIDAVICVQWNPYVKIGIFGVAVVDIPRGVKTKFAHVELGISAVVDFQAGVMKFEAQLSPRSFIFDPSCHLTGGFALYYWFAGSGALEGDWVFSIGGFHRAFDRPAHYPNPPRLGISWSVDRAISITGEAYFAITPKCCMGGGRLRASLRLGPLEAWFEAYADFLIKYRPFHFMADGGVSVGISCKVDLLITSFTIKVEIGARLHLEGPPLCGRVHVDFWIVAFDIDFGPSPKRADPVSLPAFYDLVIQAGEGSTRGLLAIQHEAEDTAKITSDDDHAHVFGCRSGMLAGADSTADSTADKNPPWQVRSGTFSFDIDCKFAIGKATVAPAAEFPSMAAEEPEAREVLWNTPIYAKPMQLTAGLTSELEVSIERAPGSRAEITEEFKEPQWRLSRILKPVPTALWGKYDPRDDPAQQGNNVGSLLNGKDVAIQLMMGVSVAAPKALLAQDKIPKFNVVDAMSQSVNVPSHEPLFPKYAPANAAWSPDEVKDEDSQWAAVAALWRTPQGGVESRKTTLALWGEAMFWETGVTAEVPELLLEKFDNLYLSAPMISVA
ncbi:hypothetical protein FN846DRAFT_954000 [Sphaerosporella brunnea]|uniref:DUF6603 domain-containing protein n=1 Tax=Sphaerosporella brunnea TaxID=1250544 RepID=A0A5J5EVE2_9PEZI|nr:hypothetical protein FN846DRAFT_954000 [Sphaerosporella brunnea]